MSLPKNKDICVLNFNYVDIFADARNESYRFPKCKNGKPSVTYVSLPDLQTISSNTGLIEHGWLTFDDEDKEDVFQELRLYDWKNILSIEEIDDILLNPTIEGLQKSLTLLILIILKELEQKCLN